MKLRQELRTLMTDNENIKVFLEDLKESCRKAAIAGDSSFTTNISVNDYPYNVVKIACGILRLEDLNAEYKYVSDQRDGDYIRVIISW